MVALGVLSAEVAFLHELLRIVPGAAGIGHEDCEHEACAETADEEAEHACHAEHDAHEDGDDDCDECGNEHFLLGGLGGDLHAALVVRGALTGEDALDLAELPADLDHHLGCRASHCVHREAAEEERHHRTDEHACKHCRIHQADVVVVKDVEYACSGGVNLAGYAVHQFSCTVERNLDLLDVGCEECKCGECRGTDGEALSGGGGGVAEGVEDVGALTDLRLEFGHLRIAAGIVGDGAVCIGGEGDSEGAEHTNCRDGHAVETLGKVGGGHHVLHVESDCEQVGEDDGAGDCEHGNGGGAHSEAHAADDDGGGTGLGRLRELLGRLV